MSGLLDKAHLKKDMMIKQEKQKLLETENEEKLCRIGWQVGTIYPVFVSIADQKLIRIFGRI